MMLFFLLFSTLIAALVLGCVLPPLRGPWWARCAVALVVLLVAFKFQITHLFGGRAFFGPAQPEWLHLFLTWLYASQLLYVIPLLAIALLRMLARLGLLLARTPCPRWYPTCVNGLHLAILLATLAFVAAAIRNGRAEPRLRELAIQIPGLPADADGLRIVHLTDLHVDPITRGDRIRRIVERVNALHPDLVALTGDYVDGPVAEFAPDLAPLADLHARYGVFAVPGNHEYYSGFQPWMDYLETLGMHLLLNRAETLPCQVAVAGITDPNARRFQLDPPDLPRALRDIPQDTPVILLAHQPRHAHEANRLRVALQLSGHTHGGMLPILDPLMKRTNAGFVSGLYRLPNTTLYVSNGTGMWSGFPLRIRRPAEITLITLHAAP